MRLIAAVLAAMILAGCAGGSQREAQRYADITKEQARLRITISDDRFEQKAEINTKEVFKLKGGLLGITWDDNFLRAYIDKKTGEVVYQVYDIIYMKEWSRYYEVSYDADGGTKTQELIRIDADVESCSSNAFIGCTLREDVAWIVDRKILDSVADKYQAGQRQAWKYKLKARTGEDQVRPITSAEVWALLHAVDTYLKASGLTAKQPSQKVQAKPLDDQDREFGKQSIAAEDFAESQGCKSEDGTAVQGFMIIKDYTEETYQFQCESGDMLVRCEAGACELL